MVSGVLQSQDTEACVVCKALSFGSFRERGEPVSRVYYTLPWSLQGLRSSDPPPSVGAGR